MYILFELFERIAPIEMRYLLPGERYRYVMWHMANRLLKIDWLGSGNNVSIMV